MTDKCKAYQASDQMVCPCGLRWDMNDPYPPGCSRDAGFGCAHDRSMNFPFGIIVGALILALVIFGARCAQAQDSMPERINTPSTYTGSFTGLDARPADCPPTRWCGCWLMKHMGLNDRDLWLAWNWAVKRPRVAGPCVGCIAVWRHHVGKITALIGPGKAYVLSGNDGRQVRNRPWSLHGAVFVQ